MRDMRVERLDHLGIVAGICREIGLAEYLDALVGPSQQRVSVGTVSTASRAAHCRRQPNSRVFSDGS